MKQRDLSEDDWRLFRDAVFLHKHPGWTWQAMQDAPADVIDLLTRMDNVTTKKG